jgi:hypothetical protein
MAVIYMQHPKHGSKVACSEAEAKYDEEKGWKRSATVTAAVASTASAVVVDEKTAVIEQYKAKFGKAPHHKKKLETIRAELAA